MELQELIDEIMEAMGGIAESIEKLDEELIKVFKKIEEQDRLLCRPPKWYAKANKPAILVSRIRVFHCRNNC